jgi:hypothetical protein
MKKLILIISLISSTLIYSQTLTINNNTTVNFEILDFFDEDCAGSDNNCLGVGTCFPTLTPGTATFSQTSAFAPTGNFPKINLWDPATSAVITLYTDNTAQCSFWTTTGTSVFFGGFIFTWTENPLTKDVTIDIN